MPRILFQSKGDLKLADVSVVPILTDMSLLFLTKKDDTKIRQLNLIDLSSKEIESKIVHTFMTHNIVYMQLDPDAEDLAMPYFDEESNFMRRKWSI